MSDTRGHNNIIYSHPMAVEAAAPMAVEIVARSRKSVIPKNPRQYFNKRKVLREA